MDDVFVIGIARPRYVARAGGEWRTNRMYARNERAVVTQHFEHRASHARHDSHTRRDIRTVGQLNANMRDRTAQRSH